jgi:hypothetical protein
LTARHTIEKGVFFVNENGHINRASEVPKTINGKKANNHPVLRKHLILGAETLFVNEAFTKTI